MIEAQSKSRRRVTTTASQPSGGHGARTRNRFPGTTFPVSPLAIRLPSGNKRQRTTYVHEILAHGGRIG